MPSICASPLRVPAVRLTQLDSCGNVVEGDCASATSTGIITIEQTLELNDRQDYFTVNADNEVCIDDTAPPILKWINLTITFCNVDPELFNIATAEPLILDDVTPTPNAVGFGTDVGSVDNSFFAFEAWTRLSRSNACDGGTQRYGYFLLPFLSEGMTGDLTLENGLANFTVTARSNANSLWGVGPYNIQLTQAAPAGVPSPLFSPIPSNRHRQMQWVNLAPPAGVCGCTALPLELTVTATGAGTHPATVTFPTPTSTTLPAIIDWGDASTDTVTTGSSMVHDYASAGTYDVTFSPTSYSSASYEGTVTVA